MRIVGMIAVILVSISVSHAQPAGDVEAAKRKLAEKQKQRDATSQPTVPVEQRPAKLPAQKVLIWKPKAGAPPEILSWYQQFPSLRRDVEARLLRERDRAEQEMKRVGNRKLSQDSVRDTFGGIHYKANAQDAAKRRSQVRDQKGNVAQIDKRIKSLREDSDYVPVPEFKNKKGAFGELGIVKIIQIQDKSNCIITHGDVNYWLSGCDTTPFADDMSVIVSTPVKVDGSKSYTTVTGAQRTVFLLKPFDWTEHLERVMVTKAEADGFWGAAPAVVENAPKVMVARPRNEQR